MAKYMYGWNSVNHKKEYRGKYPDANPRGQGYFGLNDAENDQDFVPKKTGVKREFKGSRSEEYPFFDTIHGMRTFTATSYEDALRQAEVEGYTASDYIGDKRRRRGKR